MEKKEQVIISFLGDKQTKSLLTKWAEEDERSMSYILRKLIKKEAQDREQEKGKK